MTFSVATVVLKWMYTDALENELGDGIILDVLSAAMKFRLDDLKKRHVRQTEPSSLRTRTFVAAVRH